MIYKLIIISKIITVMIWNLIYVNAVEIRRETTIASIYISTHKVRKTATISILNDK